MQQVQQRESQWVLVRSNHNGRCNVGCSQALHTSIAPHCGMSMEIWRNYEVNREEWIVVKWRGCVQVFGVANVTKMLHELPPPHREDCVNSLAYEADARVQDPVYGCVGAISVLQQQVFTSFALAFFFSSSQSLSNSITTFSNKNHLPFKSLVSLEVLVFFY